MHVKKLVVEEVEDPSHEIQIEAAQKFSKRAKNGDVIAIPVETKKFGRIAAQAAKRSSFREFVKQSAGLFTRSLPPKSMRS